jgi:hypothetical protein
MLAFIDTVFWMIRIVKWHSSRDLLSRARRWRLYQYGLKRVPRCGGRNQGRRPFITNQDIVRLRNELRGGGCGSQ